MLPPELASPPSLRPTALRSQRPRPQLRACSHATVAAVATLAATDEPPATLPNPATPTFTPIPTPAAVSMALSTLSSALAAGPLEPSAAATLVTLASHPSLSPLP